MPTRTPQHATRDDIATSLDVVLVAPGVIAVVVTTFSTLYLIRPGETRAHSKRRILEDGREGSR